MFIELVDALRCTRPHEDTWLVASILERDDRVIRTGILGCPICTREYPIRDGVAWFGVEPTVARGRHARAHDASHASEGAMLLGALLGAAEGATIAVAGTWAGAAVALTEVLPMRVYVVNADAPVEDSERIASIESGEGVPLAAGALRGIALDAENASPADLTSAIRALAPGGRLVAPAATPMPPELAEIVRDERWWVAEKPRPLVDLRRR